MAALLASVMCRAPSLSCQASQVSTVPSLAVRPFAGSALVEQPGELGGRLGWGRSGCPRPAAPGRCRPCAGPASPARARGACPVRASHAMAEARWAVMPTASTGPRLGQGCGGATSRAAAAIAAGSNSTRPGIGTWGAADGGGRGSTVASGRTMAARTLLVPTSITRMLMVNPPEGAVVEAAAATLPSPGPAGRPGRVPGWPAARSLRATAVRRRARAGPAFRG